VSPMEQIGLTLIAIGIGVFIGGLIVIAIYDTHE
jgi:hypothetical protein